MEPELANGHSRAGTHDAAENPLFATLARIEHDLGEIALVHPDFRPDRVLGNKLDQGVPITEHEIHYASPVALPKRGM